MISTILLGTTNRKKIVEMRPLLEPLGYSMVDLSDMPATAEVDETGDDFISNARLKAVTYASRFSMWTIGEDSGLCVPALGGEPGVYSARYASLPHHANLVAANDSLTMTQDQANNRLLLDKLLSTSERAAYYVSTIVLASPSGESLIESSGECWGRIIKEPRGVGGFGYDPLFEVAEYHRTFAELGLSVKRVLSHRARALAKFLRLLHQLQN